MKTVKDALRAKLRELDDETEYGPAFEGRNADKLLGSVRIDGELLIAVATRNRRFNWDNCTYDPDADLRGCFEILIHNADTGENWTSAGSAARVEQMLAYLRKQRLSLWQLNELFGYDGMSDGLAAHIESFMPVT